MDEGEIETRKAALARRIDQALGRAPFDLLIENVRVLETTTGAIEEARIGVTGDHVTAYCRERDADGDREMQGARVVDAGGRIAAPGLIDAHLHIESSMATPFEFERAVLARGVTTAVCDPHEIANVLGVPGIRYFLDAAPRLAMNLVVQMSSCVPATKLETAGAEILASDLIEPFADPAAGGLAEMMNFPGVWFKDPDVMEKLARFSDAIIDGHAPLVRGSGLDAYLSCGVASDHECVGLEEAREKLAKGMFVFLREGSVAKNVEELWRLIDDRNCLRLAFCTDDRNPLEIEEEGQLDHALRKAIALGAPPIAAWRAATLGAATAHGLRDRGLIGPGKRADLVLLDSLEEVRVAQCFVGGKRQDEAIAARLGPSEDRGFGRGSLKRAPVAPRDLEVAAKGESVEAIVVLESSLITDRETVRPPRRDGVFAADPVNGLHKLCVLERHGKNGAIGRAFVKGFGPMRGAIAFSVGHDSHNLIAVGGDDASMAAALNRVIALDGGCAIAEGDAILADLALPIAGLMSDQPLAVITERLRALRQSGRDLGCALGEPLLQLAFLALPVIPHLKLTDQGLVDVDRMAFVD